MRNVNLYYAAVIGVVSFKGKYGSLLQRMVACSVHYGHSGLLVYFHLPFWLELIQSILHP